MEFLLQVIGAGLLRGLSYTLIAVSLVLVYKSSEVFNFAIGEFCTLGAILFYLVHYVFKLPILLTFPVYFLLTWVCATIIEKTMVNPLLGRPSLSVTMATIGLSSFLLGLFQLTLGTNPVPFSLELPRLRLEIGDILFVSTQVWSAIFAVSAVILLLLFYKYTRYGIVMRATAEGQVKAIAFGIDAKFTLLLTWCIASMTAALGGVSIANGSVVNYDMGIVGIVAIPVVLVGGLESIPGAIVGGLLIGTVEAITTTMIEPLIGLDGFSRITPYLVLLIILFIRPFGLFGQVRIERV